jgi:hypothetical protein
MEHISIASESQQNPHVQSKIDYFFNRFRIGTLLHPCGARKRHGHGDRSLTQAIMDTALKCVGLSKNNWGINPES